MKKPSAIAIARKLIWKKTLIIVQKMNKNTKAEYLAEIRKIIPDSFILVPGVGAQGGSLPEVCKYGITKNIGLLINSSRGIIYASNGEDFAITARTKAKELQQAMKKEMELC